METDTDCITPYPQATWAPRELRCGAAAKLCMAKLTPPKSNCDGVGYTMSELQTPWMNDKLGMSLTPAGVLKAYEHTVSAQALPKQSK